MRTLLVALGTAAIGYGGWLLVHTQRPAQVREVVVWLAAAIVLHDAVVAPVVVAVGWVAGRLLPPGVARGGAATLVLLGPLVVVAVPVLGRFGARPDNPTLLDRDYVGGLAAAAAVCVVLGTAVALGGRRGLRSRQQRTKEG